VKERGYQADGAWAERRRTGRPTGERREKRPWNAQETDVLGVMRRRWQSLAIRLPVETLGPAVRGRVEANLAVLLVSFAAQDAALPVGGSRRRCGRGGMVGRPRAVRNLAIPAGSRTKARSFMRLPQPGHTSTSTPNVRRKSSAHGR